MKSKKLSANWQDNIIPIKIPAIKKRRKNSNLLMKRMKCWEILPKERNMMNLAVIGGSLNRREPVNRVVVLIGQLMVVAMVVHFIMKAIRMIFLEVKEEAVSLIFLKHFLDGEAGGAASVHNRKLNLKDRIMKLKWNLPSKKHIMVQVALYRYMMKNCASLQKPGRMMDNFYV